MTSARIDESNEFELVSIYLVGDDGSFVLNSLDNFEPQQSKISREDLIDLYNNQGYYPYQLIYGSPRTFHDPNSQSLATFLANKIHSQSEHPEFHKALYKTLSEFGESYKGQ